MFKEEIYLQKKEFRGTDERQINIKGVSLEMLS